MANKTAKKQVSPTQPVLKADGAEPKDPRKARAVPSELVKIEVLKPHSKNYRQHGTDQLVHIIESIKANGFYKNVVVAKDYTILAGHGAVEAATQLGLKEIPVVRLNLDPFSKLALKVLTGDNEMARLGVVDDRALSEILRDIATDAQSLIGTGFDQKMLANLVFVTRHSDEIKDFNAAAEWLGLPAYEATDPVKADEPVLVISFATAEDRERFVEEKQLQIRDKRGGKKWSTVWPYQERNDIIAVRFEDKGADQPQKGTPQ